MSPPVKLVAYLSKSYLGASREILDLFALSEKITFDYHAYPIEAAAEALIDGDADFKFPDDPSWQDTNQSKQTLYSTPLFKVPLAILTYTGVHKINTLGILEGFEFPEILTIIKQNKIKAVYFDTVEELLTAFKERDINALFLAQPIAEQNLNITLKTIFYSRYDYYSLSTIKHPQIINQLNRWIVHNKDLIHAIAEQYGLKTAAERW